MKLNALKDKKGSALLWVILMTIIITILLGAVLAATYAYFNYTTYTVKKQQAYFTARSAINMCLEEIQSDEGAGVAILPEKNKEVNITDFGFNAEMGTATAKITRDKNDGVLIEVDSKYADETYHMEASVARTPVTFGGVAISKLTLNGNLTLSPGTDFYWNNDEIFDTTSTDINKACHRKDSSNTLTIWGNLVTKKDAKIAKNTVVAGKKFKQDTEFKVENGDLSKSKKIWNKNQFVISNKLLTVSDSENTEYTQTTIDKLKNITNTHPVYCNNSNNNVGFGNKLAGTTADTLIGLLGLDNIMNDLKDDVLKLSNNETSSLGIQYIEVLSLSTKLQNTFNEKSSNARTWLGRQWYESLNNTMNALQKTKLFYNTLDVSYIDYSSNGEGNKADNITPLTYLFARGGDAVGITVRVRYGAEPEKRSGIGQVVSNVTSNVESFISSAFDLNNNSSYVVVYLENNATIHLGYDDDGHRDETNKNPANLIFLYSIYGGKGTKVVLHDGVIVCGEIICDELIIDDGANAKIVYTSTNGGQVAKQKIDEIWSVTGYSD